MMASSCPELPRVWCQHVPKALSRWGVGASGCRGPPPHPRHPGTAGRGLKGPFDKLLRLKNKRGHGDQAVLADVGSRACLRKAGLCATRSPGEVIPRPIWGPLCSPLGLPPGSRDRKDAVTAVGVGEGSQHPTILLGPSGKAFNLRTQVQGESS